MILEAHARFGELATLLAQQAALAEEDGEDAHHRREDEDRLRPVADCGGEISSYPEMAEHSLARGGHLHGVTGNRENDQDNWNRKIFKSNVSFPALLRDVGSHHRTLGERLAIVCNPVDQLVAGPDEPQAEQ